MCQKKTVSKNTVTELAERAMINKGTFYPYYIDIYTLYTEIIKEACMFIFDKIEDYSHTQIPEAVYFNHISF